MNRVAIVAGARTPKDPTRALHAIRPILNVIQDLHEIGNSSWTFPWRVEFRVAFSGTHG